MEKLWFASVDEEQYRNPIIFADYSDPDVIRVEDTYYMTASSFNMVPGLPILVSKDLINWELKNYATGNIEYPGYEIPRHSAGVWAPAIRYREGLFYIYYGMPDEGIFVVTAEDPLGKWSKPKLVLEGKGLIDSCPFWDEDGSAWCVHAYAKSRCGFNSRLGIFQMSADGMTAISEDEIIYNGEGVNPTIEGPKIYKINGKYYILAPAGGVSNGWQVALRSDSIKGPYEVMTVMHQGDTVINGPHQGALVDTMDGEEYFIHFQQNGLYGRIIHMQPVRWIDGWPVMGEPEKKVPGDENNVYCGKPVYVYDKPKAAIGQADKSLLATDDFDEDKLNLMWQWMGNYKEEFYSLTANPSHLRLYCQNVAKEENITLWNSPNVLTQKIVCPYFEARVMVRTAGIKDTDEDSQTRIGIALMGKDYAYLAVKKCDVGFRIVYGVSVTGKKGVREVEMASYDMGHDFEYVILVINFEREGDKPRFMMNYILPSGEYGTVMPSYAFTPEYNNWVGAKIGLFAAGNAEGSYGDFDYIHVTATEEGYNEF